MSLAAPRLENARTETLPPVCWWRARRSFSWTMERAHFAESYRSLSPMIVDPRTANVQSLVVSRLGLDTCTKALCSSWSSSKFENWIWLTVRCIRTSSSVSHWVSATKSELVRNPFTSQMFVLNSSRTCQLISKRSNGRARENLDVERRTERYPRRIPSKYPSSTLNNSIPPGAISSMTVEASAGAASERCDPRWFPNLDTIDREGRCWSLQLFLLRWKQH